MPLEGRPLAAPVDLRDLLRVGLDAEPDAVAMSSATDRITWRELERATDRLARNYVALGLRAGRPGRVADAQPHPARGALPRVLPGGTRHHAARTTATRHRRSTTRSRSAARRRSWPTPSAPTTSPPARAGRRAAADRAEGRLGDGPTLEQLCVDDPGAVTPRPTPRRRPRPRSSSRPAAPVRPRASPTASTRSAGWRRARSTASSSPTADTFLPGSSMSHVGSFLWALASFSVGAHVVVGARTFDAGEILPLLRAHRPTVLAMIPAALTALVRDHGVTAADFESLRLCRAGADKVSLELEHEFQALSGLLIDEGYGMTEVGLATLNPPRGPIKQGRSAGPSAASPSACATTTRCECAQRHRRPGLDPHPQPDHRLLGEPGRDRRDPARRLARLRRPRARRRRRLPLVLRPEEADHRARRLEHQSRSRSRSALAEHPAVALVGVVGIHDEVHGENVRAYVTIQDGAERPTSHDLIEFARERVGYKAPEEVVFLDEMPVNPTGKLDRVAAQGAWPRTTCTRTDCRHDRAGALRHADRAVRDRLGRRPHRRHAAAGAAGRPTPDDDCTTASTARRARPSRARHRP